MHWCTVHGMGAGAYYGRVEYRQVLCGFTPENHLMCLKAYTGGNEMKVLKIIAVLLVAAGLYVLVYGGFNYPKSNHEAKIGSIEFDVKNEGRTHVPEWAGVAAVVLGTLMLLVPSRKG